MVLRYWGARDLTAESFAGLVDRSAAGIRTDVLQQELEARGWTAVAVRGQPAVITGELDAGRPVIALIEDRPGTYHYVVVVGWHERGVVLHDPARVPYRVMPVDEFRRRWRPTDEWMLLVTPRSRPEEPTNPTPSSGQPAPPGGQGCGGLIERGVAQAQSGDFEAAEQTLTQALGCPGSAALTELAGLRVLQRRWPEVVELSSRAVFEDASQAHAWELLATGRFVTDDAYGALAAWNAVGQPRLDLFRVEGLIRTDQRAVERLTFLRPGQVLTVSSLRRAERQLRDWPAATSASVSYLPRQGGLADLRVAVAERGRIPRLAALGLIGGRAAFTREVRVALGPLTRGGDRLEVGWRFWPGRPRVSADLLVPAPWGGLWGVHGSSERQPVGEPALLTMNRDSAGILLSAWQTGRVRWQTGAGIDHWLGLGRYGRVSGSVDLAAYDDSMRVHVSGQRWLGTAGFATVDVTGRMSRALGGGMWVESRVASSSVSREAPLDLWPAGDNGQVRPTLLRAHPLVRRGTFKGERLGTRVATASVEVQRLYESRGARMGPAVFVDVGRTAGRLVAPTVIDTDVGIGFRARLPGVPGAIRADIAKGLRDGATAISFVYEP